MINIELSPRRMTLLWKKDFIESLPAVLIATAAVAGVFLIGGIVTGGFGTTDPGALAGNFISILMLGRLITTSLAFGDLHKKGRNISWLMTPASQLEKYLYELLVSTVGVVVYVTAAYFILSLLTHGITTLLFHRGIGIFNPFTRPIGLGILLYLEFQAIFFFGSVFFKSGHFIKTVLWMAIIGIGVSIFAGLAFRIVYADWFVGITFRPRPELEHLFHGDAIGQAFEEAFRPFLRVMEVIGRILLYLFPPFFWVAGYFRLVETEVRNGV
jgi:ABC-type multidrug transport system fused ATPase/permease subunit